MPRNPPPHETAAIIITSLNSHITCGLNTHQTRTTTPSLERFMMVRLQGNFFFSAFKILLLAAATTPLHDGFLCSSPFRNHQPYRLQQRISPPSDSYKLLERDLFISVRWHFIIRQRLQLTHIFTSHIATCQTVNVFELVAAMCATTGSVHFMETAWK